MSMKNSNGTVGNRIRNLPACSKVPQPTAAPRTQMEEEDSTKMNLNETGRDCEEQAFSSEHDIVAGSCERRNETWVPRNLGNLFNS
jgi:hypothetical protein